MQAAILAMTAAQIRQFLLSGGGVVQVALALTAAQVNTLASVPILVVSAAALATGEVLSPVWWSFEQRLSATIFVGVPSVRIRYAGVAVDLAGSDGLSNIANEYRFGLHNYIAGVNLGVGVHAANRDLELTATADTTAGSGTFLLNLAYQVMRGPAL
jgi:hypothetical protein